MANETTSRTDSVLSDVVTHKIRNKKEGTFCYLKYTKGSGGTNVSLAFTFIDPDLNATDEYKQIYLDSSMVPVVQTFSFSASGNYRIPVPVAQGEKIVKATVTYTGGTASAAVVDFRDE